MSSRAPKPKHDAIRTGREAAVQERAAVWPYLIREIVIGGVFYGPLALLAYRCWKRGDSWLGIAIFSLGSLAVVVWFAVRQVRAARERTRLADRLRETRRRLRARAHPALRLDDPAARP